MSQIIAIAFGGALGAIMRHFVASQVYHWFGRDFPYGTLSVNVIGSFLMGFLGVFLIEKVQVSVEIRVFFLVGLLGAFTTFSTFSLDAFYLIQKGQNLRALGYMLGSVILCVIVCWLGFMLARQISGGNTF